MPRALLPFVVLLACARDRPPEGAAIAPGGTPYEGSLARGIGEALAKRGPGYVARTRHKRDNGAPRYTNRLIFESSPYLLQHAHNPVDWYPWGDEAFAAARARGVPVFLSVGYSTCHWCHVMEEESFEDEAIARQINEGFVAIKVDREERPDLDELYMTAVQLHGGGGWPMTVFLLPDKRPFFGGTYFPPTDGPRGPGLPTVLTQTALAFHEDSAQVVQRAQDISAELKRIAAKAAAATGDPQASVLRTAVAGLLRAHDKTWGGFGGAPKFPRPSTVELLLRYHRRTGDATALAAVTRTLERIAAGGIRDHVGGGFHRYAVDVRWKVPHFEKMLYDNAQLAALYAAAHQATGRADFAEVARDTLEYLLRDLRAPGGAFWAASDADTAGVEGATFTWTAAEIDRVLGPDDGAIVRAAYDVTAGGNYEGGRSILWRPDGLDEVAARLAMPVERVQAVLTDARPRLRAARKARAQPAIDRKVLVAWNGLAISAFAKVGFALGEPRYLAAAREAASYLLSTARGAHSVVDGVASGVAFLDDVALLEAALLDLYEADPDPRWLREAIALQAVADRDLADARGGYFLTGSGHEQLLTRDKPGRDDPVPSGNAAAAMNLMRLAELTSDEAYRKRAMATLRAFQLGDGAAALLAALDFALDKPKQIVVVHPGSEPPEMLAAIRTSYVPNRVIVRVAEGDVDTLVARVPLVERKRALKGVATAYVCIGSHCERPTSDAEILRGQLAAVEPLAP